MSDDFYRAFEDRFRGSRETVKSRLRAYLEFVAPLRALRGECSAIDLGCGRGEWLEVLVEAGVRAGGVDLDEGMLQSARAAGLDVTQGEAVATMRGLPAESRDIVSALHVAEHLRFEDLVALVREAHRVLRPGGLLILETPDPENLTVATVGFHLDPTHERPIPAGLLAFLPEHHGFQRVKIVRLQEAPGLAEAAAPGLLNVLRDASADAGVVAQKGGAPDAAAALDRAFAREYGVTALMLAARYDAALEQRLHRAESRAEEAARRVQELLDSRSWRMTAPLRAVAAAIQQLFGRSPK
jgi:SAM-dependent methyltransferase